MTRIDLPFSRPPLSLNDRMHWATKARHTRAIRTATKVRALAVRCPQHERIAVTLHYRPRDNRPRDIDNLFATLKPCIDGLRDAGIVPEDDRSRVQPNVVIHDAIKGESGALWLEVEPC